MMNSEEIKRLLDRYYEGETTLEEEQLLKQFFNQTDIPDDLSNDKEVFRYYVQLASVPEPSSGFENRIIAAINSEDQKSSGSVQRRIIRIMTGIAAGILIITGTYFFFIHKSEPRDTYSDPEVAYAETMKILYYVSSSLNHGTQALDQIGKMHNETQKSLAIINRPIEIMREKMKPLTHLQKAMEIIDGNYDKNNK